MAEDDDPLDPAAEVAVEQQPVAAQRVLAGARAAAGLGEQRPAAVLGEHPGGRARVVAGDDDGPRARRDADLDRRAISVQTLRFARAHASGTHRSSGTSGSSSWTLRCTGPCAARRSRAREVGGAARSTVATSGPKMPTWSVVWLALVPRSRAGRSAVTTTSGRPAWAASSTAGCRLATAVPDVHTTAARAWFRVRPRARKPAVRSSIRVCSRSSPASAASYAANASGALREPGASTTSVTPASTSAVTTARASSVEGVVTSGDPAARPAPRPAGPPSGDPVRRRGQAARAASSTSAGPTGSAPSTGSREELTTSSVSSCTVASPQA